MQGAKDLIASERGVFCIVLVVAATILAALKIITGADWLSFANVTLVTLVGSKTVTSAIESWKGKDPAPTPPPSAQS